jgi:hypothetical protein
MQGALMNALEQLTEEDIVFFERDSERNLVRLRAS